MMSLFYVYLSIIHKSTDLEIILCGQNQNSEASSVLICEMVRMAFSVVC